MWRGWKLHVWEFPQLWGSLQLLWIIGISSYTSTAEEGHQAHQGALLNHFMAGTQHLTYSNCCWNQHCAAFKSKSIIQLWIHKSSGGSCLGVFVWCGVCLFVFFLAKNKKYSSEQNILDYISCKNCREKSFQLRMLKLNIDFSSF